MRRTSILFTTLILLLACGCSMFQNVDTALQLTLIKASARTGTWLGLNEIEDIAERRHLTLLLRDDIMYNIMPLLEDPGVTIKISAENREMLLLKLPIEARPFLSDALDILDAYMKQADLTANLDDNAINLLREFFKGVVEGCNMILIEVGANYDGLGINRSRCFS